MDASEVGVEANLGLRAVWQWTAPKKGDDVCVDGRARSSAAQWRHKLRIALFGRTPRPTRYTDSLMGKLLFEKEWNGTE